MKEMIVNNPFRILGVYANSPQRDINANKKDLDAFLKVGSPIHFPLDLEEQLGPVVRTPESVASAYSQVSLERNKAEAAQFWFLDCTFNDKNAINNLRLGYTDDAIRIWMLHEDMSSLHNLSIIHLIAGEYEKATLCASKVYTQYFNAFAAALGLTPSISKSSLVLNYVSKLSSETSVSCLTGSNYPDEWNALVTGKTVAPPVYTPSEAEPIAFTPSESVSPAYTPSESVPPPFIPAEPMAPGGAPPESGPQGYTLTEIDSPEGMPPPIPNPGSQIPYDLTGIVPPSQVLEEHNNLQALLSDYDQKPQDLYHAEELLLKASPLLGPIKKKLGANDYYINVSTIVSNRALQILIGVLNSAIANKEDLSNIINPAIRLGNRLKMMDMDADTKQHLNENYAILKKIESDINAAIESSSNGGEEKGCGSRIVEIIITIIIVVLIRCCREGVFD